MQPVRRLKRRGFAVLLLFSLTWAGLLSRLWWIQLGSPHHFSRHDIDLVKNAVRQRQQTVTLNTGRGEILDRNGYPFTGVEQKALVVFPLARGGLAGNSGLLQVAKIIGQPQEKIASLLDAGKTPVMLRDHAGKIISLSDDQAKRVNDLQLPGILSLSVTERYPSDEVAKHVIGFVNQNPDFLKQAYSEELQRGDMSLDTMVGAAGLERSFDRFLQGVEPSTLSYYVDGEGNPLRGLDVRYAQKNNQFYPLSLVTTLDRDIQQRMEQVADKSGLEEGAIVVLDAKSGDVVAMVSRPVYDQNHVDVKTGDWQNHALKQLPPGSVFKTVVAAAAMAEGVVTPTEHFYCPGEYGKYGFSCWKKDGHGSITMDEAFADSCNITFAEIAKRLGPEKIEEYAKRLGLTTTVGYETPLLFRLQNFHQFDAEEKGQIFTDKKLEHDEGVLIQTAIGQRDVRITPLQAANMMATILRGGQPGEVRLVSDISYRNGQTFHHFSPKMLPQEGIDQVTALKLTRLLRSVVEEGTGQALRNAAWPVAGKSGTAQVVKNGQPRNHQWFVGYAPADKPHYAIAVVEENQPVGLAGQATQLFDHVTAELAAQSKQSAPPRETTR